MVDGGAGKSMGMNKKGIVFTLMALIILSLFLISFSVISEFEERRVVEDRVESLNDFVFSIEEDIPRQLFTSGFRVIFLLEKEIVESGEYVSNFDSAFQEGFYNGTVNGVYDELMDGSTFSGIVDAINEKAGKVNAEISMENPVVEAKQNNPWNVNVSLTADVVIKDDANLALWNKTQTYEVAIPISNFDDPLYLVETNGLILKKMVRTPYSVFVSGSDVSNLSSHLQNNYYFESSGGPSFLERLEGNLVGVDSNGVESFIHAQQFSQKGLSVQDKSVVDYIYFSSNNPEACPVTPSGMPSWFKLDALDNHENNYQVSRNCGASP